MKHEVSRMRRVFWRWYWVAILALAIAQWQIYSVAKAAAQLSLQNAYMLQSVLAKLSGET